MVLSILPAATTGHLVKESSPGGERRRIWLLVPLAAVALVLLFYFAGSERLKQVLERSDDVPVQSGASPEVNRPAQTRVNPQEDWDADGTKLNWMEVNFVKYRSGILTYSMRPEFLSYKSELSTLIYFADTLHQYADAESKTAIAKRDSERFTDYSSMEASAGAILEGVFEDMENPSWTAQEVGRGIDDAQDSIAAKVLSDYSQDATAIQRFGRDPADLSAMVRDASGRIGRARVLLSNGDIWGARISAAIADLENHWVAARLWEYYLDVYFPKEIQQFKKN